MADFVARRGRQLLSAEEFRAHLSLGCRLEHLAVFLGSGASVTAGGKTMKALWDEFRAKESDSISWLLEESFVSKESVEGNLTANIEELLEKLWIAETDWRRRAPHAQGIATLKSHTARLLRQIVKASILSESMMEKPQAWIAPAHLSDHISLLGKLVASRQPGQTAPWVFTTNYDFAVEWAAEARGIPVINGFAGVHYRSFAPSNFDLGYRNVHARGEARFGVYPIYLAKLHGSLSWMTGPMNAVTEKSCEALFPALQEFLSGKKDELDSLLIFPGAAKYIQTSGFIYGELIRRFGDFLSAPHGCLIVNGYSFGDEHLNRVLTTALQNPTLQLIIYCTDFSAEGVSKAAPEWLKFLASSELPQVTLVGSGEEAYFDRMVDHLPEPALMEDRIEREKKIAQLLTRIAGIDSLDVPAEPQVRS